MAGLLFDGVACARGGRTLFAAMTFALRPGSAAVVSGPNGAGKSSLLRLAAGLLVATEGRIERMGAVSLADESLALDARLPLARALGFWAEIDDAHMRLPPALAATGIAHLAAVPVRMLSTGQRKRASLARVIASGAPIWLLDEPANGLDSAGLAMLEQAIADHRAQGGIILAATHMPIAIPEAIALSIAGSPQ